MQFVGRPSKAADAGVFLAGSEARPPFYKSVKACFSGKD
jgi:hypothetical protein